MPHGFRGEVVKTYLTKVEEALSIAIEVHSRDPLRGAPTARTGSPFIPTQRNETVPHPADTAHIGGWDTGFGNSRNIVIDETRYREVAIQIANPIEQDFLIELTSMKREIEDVCNSDFTLPQVVVRLRFFLHKIESMFPHSQQLSDDYNTVMMDFARKVLDGSSQLVVWNMDNAKDIQDENDRAITNQANNMEMTISNCESAVVTLEARWDERDFVARTAMKTITNSRGRSRRVPDTVRRTEARLDANEIQAQKNALNTTIGELKMEISELQRAKADANRFFTNTENILLSLDRDFGGKARDVKNDICNFTNRLEEMYNDMEYAFDDSFNNRPDFLRWLSENHRDMYLEIIEADARRILDKLWHGEIAWADLINRPLNEVTSAESWAIAKLLMRLENYGNTDRFLQMIADSVNADARIESIATFLSKEEQRLWHAMIPLSVDNPRVLELHLQAMGIADLRERLSLVNKISMQQELHAIPQFTRGITLGIFQIGQETWTAITNPRETIRGLITAVAYDPLNFYIQTKLSNSLNPIIRSYTLVRDIRAGDEADGVHGMGVQLGRNLGIRGSMAAGYGTGVVIGGITRVGAISVNTTRASIMSTSGLNVVRPPTVASVRTSYLRSNVPRVEWVANRGLTIRNIAHLDDVINNPNILKNSTPQEVYRFLIDNGYTVQPLSRGSTAGLLYGQGGGFKVIWGGNKIIQYHPGGGVHSGSYWKISSSSTGTIRIPISGAYAQ